MFSGHEIGQALEGSIRAVGCLLLILIPFAICGGWKMIEIVVWFFSHVKFE